MFKRTIIGAVVVAAAAAAALVVKQLNDKNNNVEEPEETEDNTIHFIEINDDEEEEGTEEDSDPLRGKSEEVKEVCGIYPYLDPDFVEETLAKNEQYQEDFPEDTLVTAEHRSSFENPAVLDAYEKIMTEAAYICMRISDTEIEARKRFFSESGAVVSDILNVANQTNALGGNYLGNRHYQ